MTTEYLNTLDKSLLYYVASPYTHKDKEIEQQRYEAVNKFASKLYNLNFILIEPIVCGHAKKHYGMPTDYEGYWKPLCRRYVEKCDALIILMLPDWDKSIGVKDEIEYAKSIGKQVYYTNVNEQ